MYKITNLSRYSDILGLYPGKSKKVQHINDNIRELQRMHLIHVEEIKVDSVTDTRAPKKDKTVVEVQTETKSDLDNEGVEI